MKLPPKIIEKFTLVPGGAYRRIYKRYGTKPPKKRYLFILNKSPQDDDVLITVTATTQITKTVRHSYVKALVFVKPEEYSVLEEESVINCTLPGEGSKADLLKAIQNEEVEPLAPLPNSILERCQEAIKATPTASPKIKRLVLGVEEPPDLSLSK